MKATLSFWEREELLRSDVLVIGGGIIGLSAAIALKEQQPTLDVALVEREVLPSGASTKNAGFACYGSTTEVLRDIDTVGEDAALEVISRRKQGLDLLRARLGDEALGFEPCGGYELLWEKQQWVIERLDYLNTLLHPLFGKDYYSLQDERIRSFGFNAEEIQHLVFTAHEGSINTGRMMKNLLRCAAERGVRIVSGADVREIDDGTDGVRVSVFRHLMQDIVQFRAEQAIVCTNALAKLFLPSLELLPGRGQVLITHPIEDLPFRGVFHFDSGYYYFRNVGNRLLFGGGRNSDFNGETTADFSTTSAIQSLLEEYMRTVILPGVEYSIDMRWAGIMGFSSSRKPIVQRCSERLTLGFGCNGMGVALGSSIGTQAAELTMGN